MGKTNKLTSLLLVLGLIAIPFFYAYYLYPNLPNKIPIHFNLQGEVDGWGSRESIFLMPFVMGLVSVFVFFTLTNIKKIDPKRYPNTDNRIFKTFGLFTVVFLTCLSLFILFGTAHTEIKMSKLIFTLLGLAFAVMGIYLPKLKQNYFVGFKLPWTLESEDNWNETHKLAGKIWLVGGLLQTVLSIFLRNEAGFILFMSITAIMVLIPVAYSFWMFKKKGEII
jgi:uncharacterized membrane protein